MKVRISSWGDSRNGVLKNTKHGWIAVKRIGLIPRNRLKHIPKHVRVQHELCFSFMTKVRVHWLSTKTLMLIWKE